jgi:hypothetical protein
LTSPTFAGAVCVAAGAWAEANDGTVTTVANIKRIFASFIIDFSSTN